MSKHQSPKRPEKPGKKTVASIKEKKEINREKFDETFSEAVSLYMLGVEGDKEAVKTAFDLLKKLHSHDPQNHQVEAYYGSAMALIGRDAVSPIDKFKNTNNGLKMLDHAVVSEPDSIEIRNLRANVCLKLPEMFFHRTSMAIEDFKYIASCYEKDDTVFPPEFYWDTLFNIGTAFKTLDYTEDAESTWDKLLSVTTDPKYKELISKERKRKAEKKVGF